MSRYEYKVVPAPSRGLKGKGIKGPEARFSHGLEDLINRLAAEGWEYQRAETLPSVERSGLTGSTTEWRNVLVFRRQVEDEAEAVRPELLPAPNPTSTSAAKRKEPLIARPEAEPQSPHRGGESNGPDPVDGDHHAASTFNPTSNLTQVKNNEKAVD